MQAHTVERVESWDSRPFPGGFRELQDLADAEFSGAVVADGTWLFELNGRVIGVFEGDIDDFEDATGTVYEAPHPSLALLFSMQERGGETQAKYYTNDTPLSEASETLADANFTGYIELSENVLSGDYYVVYYGGRSMSAAFVGTSEELVTGDEAFERADDEVGLYEVKKVPVNVTNIPEPADEPESYASTGGSTGAAAGASASGAAAAASDTTASEGDSPEDSDTEVNADGADSADGTQASEESPVSNPGQQTRASADEKSAPESTADAATQETEPQNTESQNTESGESTSAVTPAADDSDERTSPSETANQRGGATSRSRKSGSGAESAATSASESSDESGERDTAAGANAAAANAAVEAADSESGGRVFDEEKQWRNTNSVPTLDPDESESETSGSESGSTSSAAGSSATTAQQTKRSTSTRGGSSGAKSGSTVEKLKRAVKQRDAKLEEAAERIERLETERDDLDDQREELRERVEELQAERDELQSRVDDLEAKLEASDEPSGPSGREMAPEAALSETNLFVRYGSKGKPTLDELGPESDPDAINQNLRIEHHTQFDANDVTVDGEPFEAFLQQSTAYRFVSWVVRELPFEVRDAGHTSDLADVYDAIPEIDRAELDGTVAVDTEDGSISRTFDVVLRDRMGNPLLVAELNPEREPVTGDEMADLVEAATDVRSGADELSGALYVTASFFEPPALETAEAETGGGGFLSRSDKASYVNVGRKTGYHLCLVEDRNETFHLTVPEL
jgi:hypothetical protein